ncbi:cell wall-binding repeat-containing protein [Peptostreptococcus russellii]|uniref:cell wall-binding repeat-containing protein n=1 Tax=Peptostreptococcus russellii TaxID=215200 RepID=UPI0029438057|nr:cell wall-binding repeat-containing protein [Peptostreptococcus russellii]
MKTSKITITAISVAFVLSLTGTIDSHASSVKKRISGEDRVETSIKIADEFGKTNKVILATADSYADALVASPLAYEMNAPILLNRGKKLDKRILDKINKIGAREVLIVGGKNSVSIELEKELRSKGINVYRISGEDRFSTSAQIANKYTQITSVSNVVIASGENFLDALVAGPYASKIKAPILLSKKNELSAEVKFQYRKIQAQKTIVVGGVNSLNPVNISYLASGEIFADSLVAAPLAAKTNSPILLRTKYTTKENVKNYLDNNAKSVTIVGGPSTINEEMENKSKEYNYNNQSDDIKEKNIEDDKSESKVRTYIDKEYSDKKEFENNSRIYEDDRSEVETQVRAFALEEKEETAARSLRFYIDENEEKNLTESEKQKKIEEVKKEYHKMLNEYRVSKGRNPLKWCKEGEAGSNIRSEEISRIFSHTRPNGEICFTAFDYMRQPLYTGENLAYNSKDMNRYTPKEAAEKVLSQWKNSPEHNKNMLRPEYNYHSLGVTEKSGLMFFSNNLFKIR